MYKFLRAYNLIEPLWSDWMEERTCRTGRKHPRYRLMTSPAPEGRTWPCGWLTCAFGMGLAGRGRCQRYYGEWWNKDCPEYESEDDFCRRRLLSRQFSL